MLPSADSLSTQLTSWLPTPHFVKKASLTLAGIVGFAAVCSAVPYWIEKGRPLIPGALQPLGTFASGLAVGVTATKLSSVFSKTIQSQALDQLSTSSTTESDSVLSEQSQNQVSSLLEETLTPSSEWKTGVGAVFAQLIQNESSNPTEEPPIPPLETGIFSTHRWLEGIDSVDFLRPFEKLHKQTLGLRRASIEEGNHILLSDEEVKRSLDQQAKIVQAAYIENTRCARLEPYNNFKFLPCEGIALGEETDFYKGNAFKSSSPSVAGFEVGICEAQGDTRDTMEDQSIALEIEVLGTNYPLFGVFDGHAGSQASAYLKKNLHLRLQERLEIFAINKFPQTLKETLTSLASEDAISSARKTISSSYPLLSDVIIYNELKSSVPNPELQEKINQYFAAPTSPPLLTDAVIYNALKSALVQAHEDFKKEYPLNYADGSTANVVFIAGNTCYTANVGDSRSIAINPKSQLIDQLSKDAEANDPRHRKIVEFLGGSICLDSEQAWRIAGDKVRVGDLGMGSAIGDRAVVGVNPTVDITKTLLPETQETILVLACDGVWDVVTSKRLGEAISQANQKSAKELAEDTFYSALQTSSDNITVIVARKPASKPIES